VAARRDALAELDALERVFGALAHASRRQILLVLHARGDRVNAGEIAARFSCAWPTTTRHLRVLESAGLVRTLRSGRERFYELERETLLRIAGGWLRHFAPAEPRAAKGARAGRPAARGRRRRVR
jgi:DNA-binding transcriptional ArsR family regulator